MTLEKYLENKTLFYNKIDLSFVQNAWNILSPSIKPKFVIHIIGTNGKGSTGRMLSWHLLKSNRSVLHYSSPHILKFNERIWLNGEDIDNNSLNNAHLYLQNNLPNSYLKKLTYFEYTTLLALVLSHNIDFLILEAGLGGEFDATNVIKNDLTILTTIDFDHQEFLGNTINEITSTKVRSADNVIIVGKQVHDEVYHITSNIAKSKNIQFFTTNDFQASKTKHNVFKQDFLNINLLSVLATLEYLNIDINFEYLKDIIIPGRCQKIAPNITIDVGHNPLGATVILNEFINKQVYLVYNSLKDKDYKKVLSILKPIIKHLYIIKIDDPRALSLEDLKLTLDELQISSSDFIDVPKDKETLVFGSFKVVEEFLKFYEK